MTTQSLDELNAFHAVDGARWIAGPDASRGPILDVATDQCVARVSAYTAHIAT